MIDKNLDEQIIKLFYPNKKGINNKLLNLLKEYPIIFDDKFLIYLNNRYFDSESLEETLKRIKLNIEEKPKCPYCNNPVVFIGKNSKMFTKYCCNSCRAKDISKDIWVEGQKKYNLEHYGVEHNFQREDCKKKRENSLIEKYGTKNPLCNENIKYNAILTIIKNNNWYDGNLENLKDINNLKNFIYDLCKINDIDKPKTFTIQYAYNKLYSSLWGSYEYQNKRNKTLKENYTFNKSKSEDKIFILLNPLYNIEKQYSDIRYPWNCDFYIPNLDLFIEYQGSHYHHGHPFDINNKEDLKELNLLKEKSKQKHIESNKENQYDKIIYTWTDLDVRKRETAKKNNINYLEIWPDWSDEKIVNEIKKYNLIKNV